MPSLLEGVESRAWRSKQGSVQMLGAMAHCAPRQLGTALPSVVPKLSEVLSDPHPKVQLAARQALKEVGTGISVVLIPISVAIDLESLIADKQAYQEHASP